MTDSHCFDTSRLDALFAPRSIAVVGASDQASKIGGIPLDYLLRFGYGGALYAVNPRASRVQGLPAHERLAAIGAPVDLAIVAVPQSQVAGVLEDAAAARVQSMVLFSSGYAETGSDGTAAQQALARRAQEAGIRLIGPNCLGFMRPGHQVYATFSPAPGGGLVRPGRIGMVSQSGAFGAYAYSLARERGLGLSLWATTGNEADVQLADGLAWLAQDPETDVIMAYMEGCRDGPGCARPWPWRRSAASPWSCARWAPAPWARPPPHRTRPRWRATMPSMTRCSAATACCARIPSRTSSRWRPVPPSRGPPRGGPSDCSRSRAAWAP